VGYFELKLHRHILGTPETYITSCEKGHYRYPLTIITLDEIIRHNYNIQAQRFSHCVCCHVSQTDQFEFDLSEHRFILTSNALALFQSCHLTVFLRTQTLPLPLCAITLKHQETDEMSCLATGCIWSNGILPRGLIVMCLNSERRQ